MDVGIFGPLKKALSTSLNQLIQTGIARIQKVEWLQHYIAARSTAMTESNINGGWRGAGLFPRNPSRVLSQIYSSPSATHVSLSSPSNGVDASVVLDTMLLTSSPPDAIILHSANIVLNELVWNNKSLPTPARKYVPRLTSTAEQLRAENTILRHENDELKSVLSARKQRLSGKRVVLEGKVLVSTSEIHQKLLECETATKEKKKQSKKRKQFEADKEDSGDDEIEDCIVVETE